MTATASATTDPLTALVQQAMQHHVQGRRDEARQVYDQVLSQAPDHADALHLLGLLEAQLDNFERAHALIWRAITVNPGEAMFHNNLGNVCLERGQFAEAEVLYLKAIKLDNGRIDALNNLGLLLSKTGRNDEAEKLLLKAVELAPTNADWRQNLANHYLGVGRDSDALQQCHDGLVIAPRSRTLRGLLVLAYATLGLKDKAEQVLQAWVKNEPDDPYPRHHLAAITGKQVPERANDAYVVSVFDSFARSFDVKLAALSYQAPTLVAAEVSRLAGAPAQSLEVLDAGCGTGLCGPLLAPFAQVLTGIDLSEGMLRKAAAREVYDDLFCGELVAFLGSRPGAFDLVVSADTLCYFGSLAGFSQAVQAALRPGGLLVFTVEAHGDDPGLGDFILHGHGRYSQSRRYVESSLRDVGLVDVTTQPVVLRNECAKPVDGWLVCARSAGAR